jgi:hypothetical protein
LSAVGVAHPLIVSTWNSRRSKAKSEIGSKIIDAKTAHGKASRRLFSLLYSTMGKYLRITSRLVDYATGSIPYFIRSMSPTLVVTLVEI